MSRDLSELANQHGLVALGLRPRLRQYVRDMWTRRAFLWHLSKSKSSSRHQNTYLGQAWLVLNPLLLAGVYYLVFGVLLDTRGGVDNYVGFLVIGIFIFLYISATMGSAGDSIIKNLPLIRALQFPRATLPLQVVISETLTLLPALGVMVVLVTLTGETPTWTWLLLPLALLVTVLFNAGISFIIARAVQTTRDLKNLIPLITRLLRYTSGVFFSLEYYVGRYEWGFLLELQPVAVYLSLFRACMLEEYEVRADLWLWAVGWALVTLVIGLVIFWRAEERYGRD